MSIYDFAKDVRGDERSRRLLMDEDFSWSEVPRRRAAESDGRERPRRLESGPSSSDSSQPYSVATESFSETAVAVADEPDHLRGFDDDVELVDLRGAQHGLSDGWDTLDELPVGEDLYVHGEAYPDAVPGRGEASASGRRTVVITGHGAERRMPVRQHSDAGLKVHERSGFKPDRIALWAFLLALALLLGATTSSHAAVLVHHLPH